jgi:Ca-activated chloride channel family protein
MTFRITSGLLGLVTALGVGATAQDPVRPPLPHPRPIRHPAPPHVRATMLKVEASIQDGVATTDLRQTLYNDGGRVAEATWILPLPKGSTADHFTMTVGGEEIAGEVLDPQKARSIYEGIVRRMRDPGLLEYLGHGCLRARVFPIPPKGSIEVRVRYRQILPETSGLHTWLFPVRAAGVGGRSSDKLAVDLKIRSKKPIKNVYSPLAGVDVVRKGDHEARVSLELDKGQIPSRDLEVFYGVSPQAFGLDLLTWRKAQKDGHFLLMVSPRQDWPEATNTVKSIQFVLDTSGSMQGQKIEQARKALRFFVDSLKPGDYFNVVPFSTEARPFFAGPVAASAENREKARHKIAEIEARGGTNIEEALQVALGAAPPQVEAGTQAVPILVFLTDGLPTVGQTDVDQLLKQVAQNNSQSSRVFVFGVGHDVNTRLLDKIAGDTRGDRDYVREGEDIEVKTGALFTKLSSPVMTDVELHFAGVEITDQQPKALPDLFKGSRVLVLGRYRGDGHHAIRLRGKVGGEIREYVYEASFPTESGEHDFVATLWAQRKIAVLLDAIRLNGQSRELVQEIVRLGREYGIVTPYTSHLIVEEGMQIAQFRGLRPAGDGLFALDADDAAGGERLRRELERSGRVSPGAPAAELQKKLKEAKDEGRDARGRLAELPEAAASGEKAVDRSVFFARLGQSPFHQTVGGNVSGTQLVTHRVAGRTFILVGGVWIDRAYRPEMRGAERRIQAFSDEYFELLRAHPELGKAFAFSTRIVVVVGGQAIEIVDG